MKPTAFDHVALWVSQRDAIARFLCDHLGMHEIEKTDTFTLVGADARRGQGHALRRRRPARAGALDADRPARVGPRRRAREAARRTSRSTATATSPRFAGPEDLRLGLVERPTDLEYDLDHVVLSVPDPDGATGGFEELGFERRNGGLAVEDKELRLDRRRHAASPSGRCSTTWRCSWTRRTTCEAEARERGIEIAEIKDAENTLAVFVWGPDSVKVEYVEHKPGFSLV